MIARTLLLTTTTHDFDVVPNGIWRFVMHGPDGTDDPTRIVFRDIAERSRIVYENSWDLPGAPLEGKTQTFDRLNAYVSALPR